MTTTETPQRPGRYDFTSIETRWQRFWDENQTFQTPNPGESNFDSTKPKYYVLDMFPYPSGSGLHVGHPVGYCATDIIARYKRMRGFNVLHPMGFDAFGLPAEQYAIATNVHPAITTKKNIDRYRQQLKMFGLSYDWKREVTTCHPGFYKFTQWMFARMFESWYDHQCEWVDPQGKKSTGRARPISELLEHIESGRWGVDEGLNLIRSSDDPHRREWSDLSSVEQRKVLDKQRLAYLDEVSVNWCPELGTVLANEEVDNDGLSDRGSHPVYRRPLRQWMLRITSYAERLLEDLEELDWPEPIKLMQRNWVGRSTGAQVVFPLADKWRVGDGKWVHVDTGPAATGALSYQSFPDAIKVYTTRPDTLFGATYMVLAPEHPLVETVTTDEQRTAVDQYVVTAKRRSELDRTANTKEKTGVFTGGYALNPANGERIPVWVADYVLMGYGTGAIMAVPGGDTRDFEFALKFDLPIVAVVQPSTEWIEEQLAEMVGGMDQTASDGFDRIATEFPELAERIAQHKKQSEKLSDKTLSVLAGDDGTKRLMAHYLANPRKWASAFAGQGVSVQSPAEGATITLPIEACVLNGMETESAKKKIIEWLTANGVGRAAINYKLRDWIFSRQKYWGEPFPVLHDDEGGTIVLEDDELPLELPPMEDFKPTPPGDDTESVPQPPLGRATEWKTVVRNGREYRRDLNTMPQWAGSCWYYLRYIDPNNTECFADPAAERYWMPVDLYVGGAEHAVLHLLYARFWHKFLYDLDTVSTREPFGKLFNQGMIQGFAFRNGRGLIVSADRVEETGEDKFVEKETGEQVTRVIAKMSKSLHNVVNPDEIIAEYGADTFRLYEMYMGPLETSKPWNTRDVPGLHKLCQRIWRLVIDEYTDELSPALTDDPPTDDTLRVLHKTIKRVTVELEQLKFNTAIAAIFDFVNALTPMKIRPRAVIEPFVLLFAPLAPHLAEELWSRLGHDESLAYQAWPELDEALARDDQVEIAVQVCGKIQTRLMVPADADDESVKAIALKDEKVVASIGGKTIRKVIVVKGRLVNIVAT